MQLDREHVVLDQRKVLQQAAQRHGGRPKSRPSAGRVKPAAFPCEVSPQPLERAEERVHLVAGRGWFAKYFVAVTRHGSAGYRRFRTLCFRDGGHMAPDLSPTARALLTLEAIQNNPGITASKLGDRLGVTERAARRYVEILREADLPIESLTGPYGGYRVGRGMQLPPLMFTAAEAIGLVMAVLEGHRGAADPADPVGAALAKIARVLPTRLASPVLAFRDTNAPRKPTETVVNPELVTALIESCASANRLRLSYQLARRHN